MNLVEEKGTASAAETRPLEIPVDHALTVRIDHGPCGTA